MQRYKTKVITNKTSHMYGYRRRQPQQLNQGGFARFALVLAILVVGVFAFRSAIGHALDTGQTIKSGVSGYCLDVYRDNKNTNAVVDSWHCNNSSAQEWTVSTTTIEHDNNCLGVQGNATTTSSGITINGCNGAPGEVWLRDQDGYFNPNSGLCLSLGTSTGKPLVAASCNRITQASETWIPTDSGKGSRQASVTNCTSGTEGQRVACNATKEWTAWQTNTGNHENLLTAYTDGAPYEQWCADFVSYVYKESGYPFSGGETDSWDENIAGNIQNMGFIKHDAGSYTPQPGDIAYFDYPGGHVEIVVSGGPKPTFVYGDSATIDPVTGNGDMEANTITQDGAQGRVLYYLSPQPQ